MDGEFRLFDQLHGHTPCGSKRLYYTKSAVERMSNIRDGAGEMAEEEALAGGIARRAERREYRADERDRLERDDGEDHEPRRESGDRDDDTRLPRASER